ncbi:hypothetical protein K501DRAFT_278943 [Backusella circina FSU 941]|nr:hypothetical protein K501DRAFT_278943 [Backusella circina FSU 941]
MLCNIYSRIQNRPNMQFLHISSSLSALTIQRLHQGTSNDVARLNESNKKLRVCWGLLSLANSNTNYENINTSLLDVKKKNCIQEEYKIKVSQTVLQIKSTCETEYA